VAFVLLLGYDAGAAHYVAAVRCCIAAGCVVEAMPLVQVSTHQGLSSRGDCLLMFAASTVMPTVPHLCRVVVALA
jgi:hypothetical protein